MSRIHCVKCWVGVFDDVRSGKKPFEYRLNDRDYQVGDCLVLQEYNPEYDSLTGENHAVRVTYLLPGGKFGVPEKYCVMGIEPWAVPSVSEGHKEVTEVIEEADKVPITPRPSDACSVCGTAIDPAANYYVHPPSGAQVCSTDCLPRFVPRTNESTHENTRCTPFRPCPEHRPNEAPPGPSAGAAARAATEEFFGPCSPANHGDFNRLLDLMVHVWRLGFREGSRSETAVLRCADCDGSTFECSYCRLIVGAVPTGSEER